jgi:pilus assembly protein Flp/PilA
MDGASAFVMSILFGLRDRFDGRTDRGATAVEYGLLVGLIAVVIIGAVIALGGKLNGLFTSISDTLPGGEAPAG